MAATPLRRTDSAFTLVELLVSSIVLVILVLTVVGMVNAVSQGTSANRRHLEADADARRVFDRMGNDFARMLKRPDADSIFASLPDSGPDSTTGTNDKMFFYSEAPAYFDTSDANATPDPSSEGTAGLVGYRVSSDKFQLERLGKGLTWDGPSASPSPGGAVFLTYPPATIPTQYPTPTPATPFPETTLAGHWPASIGTAPTYDDGTDTDYHVLSSFVFRLEYCFALKNSLTIPATGGTTYWYLADEQSNPDIHAAFTKLKTDGYSNVAAVVVAIALLDPQGRTLIPGTPAGQTPDLTKLISALPDPTLSGTMASSVQLMAELWNKKLLDGTFATTAGIPPSLAAQVRVYQRYFPINSANPLVAPTASAAP
jgi:type II secretory pathway pseudopilin PulG